MASPSDLSPHRPSLFPSSGVQFHPESSGGPLDTIAMFDSFLDECKASKIILSGGNAASALKGVPKMMEAPSA